MITDSADRPRRSQRRIAGTSELALAVLTGIVPGSALAEGRADVDGRRSIGTSAELAERTLYRRAVEAVIWGMPAVNFELMYPGDGRRAEGGVTTRSSTGRGLPDWKNQTLTPNPDTIYFMPFFNTKDVGPVVLEIPPADEGSITGSVMDAWQSALEDVGPAGVDKGKGGKYLILPPGYTDKVPDGYIAMPSDTYQGYAILRSNLKSGSDADVAKAVAYGKRVKFYPLSQAANPPPTTFVDVDRRGVRQHDPLRRCASSSRSTASCRREPWLDARQGDDRHARSRSASRRASPSSPTRRHRPRSRTPPARRTPGSTPSTRPSSRRPSTKAAIGPCPRRPNVIEGHGDSSRQPGRYPIDMPRRHVLAAHSSAPSTWAPVSST